jgi:hypothetical protein
MLKSVLTARQHSILHPERIVGQREVIQKLGISSGNASIFLRKNSVVGNWKVHRGLQSIADLCTKENGSVNVQEDKTVAEFLPFSKSKQNLG